MRSSVCVCCCTARGLCGESVFGYSPGLYLQDGTPHYTTNKPKWRLAQRRRRIKPTRHPKFRSGSAAAGKRPGSVPTIGRLLKREKSPIMMFTQQRAHRLMLRFQSCSERDFDGYRKFSGHAAVDKRCRIVLLLIQTLGRSVAGNLTFGMFHSKIKSAADLCVCFFPACVLTACVCLGCVADLIRNCPELNELILCFFALVSQTLCLQVLIFQNH